MPRVQNPAQLPPTVAMVPASFQGHLFCTTAHAHWTASASLAFCIEVLTTESTAQFKLFGSSRVQKLHFLPLPLALEFGSLPIHLQQSYHQHFSPTRVPHVSSSHSLANAQIPRGTTKEHLAFTALCNRCAEQSQREMAVSCHLSAQAHQQPCQPTALGAIPATGLPCSTAQLSALTAHLLWPGYVGTLCYSHIGAPPLLPLV